MPSESKRRCKTGEKNKILISSNHEKFALLLFTQVHTCINCIEVLENCFSAGQISMSEQLGKIEKPEAERFKQGKKLYLVPLVYSHKDAPDEYKEKCTRYWQQVTEQLTNLVSKIGMVNRV